MNLKIKNIKGGEKILTVEDSILVSELKALVQAEFSIPSTYQKLIFKGRILDDSKTLSNYSLKGSDTIILASTYTEPEKKSDPEPVVALPPIMHPSRTTEEQKSIEENEIDPQTQTVNQGTFNFLIGNPQFEQILKIIREDPRSFEDFIMQLQTVNPELYDLIIKNKKEFIELVRGRDAESDQVQLTQEEFRDVKELMELGFSAQDCLEVYLGCGKNKEIAANLLFSNNS